MDATAQALVTAQHFIFITQVHFCAMYAVAVWDWAFALPREWRFIWRTPWTTVKVAYLFCRYWVLAVVPYVIWCFCVNHPLETCQRVYRIPVTLAMWNQVSAECILLIRTYAFFGRNRCILALLLAALGGIIAYQLYVATSQMLLLPFVTAPPLEDIGPCLPMSRPGSADLLGFFIAPLLYDTMVTIMTVTKAIVIRRHGGGTSSPLIQTFLREGVFYYLLISVANLINGIFYLQPRAVMSAICIPLSVMLSPVLACRLILDLRERGSETVAQSAGTIAFTAGVTSTKSSHGSPFSALGFGRSSSKSMLRPSGGGTMGAVPIEPMNFAMASGLELDDLRVYDSEFDVESRSTYQDTQLGRGSMGSVVSQIKVNVEKTTM